MEIKVFGSGSKGNCFLVKVKNKFGLIECGLPFKEIQKKLFDLNLTFADIDFCFVSHEHRDHCRAIEKVIQKAVSIFLSEGTKTALKLPNYWNINVVKSFDPWLTDTKDVKLNFFPLKHDALEPIGLVIDTATERLVYVADTAYIPFVFKKVTHLIVECNFCEDLILKSNQSASLKKRILKSHLGLKGLVKFLEKNDLSSLKQAWIVHLSDTHADRERILKEINKIIKKGEIICC